MENKAPERVGCPQLKVRPDKAGRSDVQTKGSKLEGTQQDLYSTDT
jgi:hypothetical protein